MTTIAEPEEQHQDRPAGDEYDLAVNRIDEAAERIRLQYKGVRVDLCGIPSRRKVAEAHKEEVARQLGADKSSVSLSTILWNAKEPAVKELRAVFGEIKRLFKDRSMTLPTTLDGIRMIRRNKIGEFHERMLVLREELAQKAANLKYALPDIIERERERRGRVFQASDYAFDPTTSCSVHWSFPSVVEDQELAELDDSVYQAELQRVRSDLRSVVELTEQEMAEQLHEALANLTERLTMNDDGQPKTFRSSTVHRLFDELDTITRAMTNDGIGGQALGEAVKQLRGVLGGQDRESMPDALRNGAGFRGEVRRQCENIANTLLNSAVPVKRRAVLLDRAKAKRERNSA